MIYMWSDRHSAYNYLIEKSELFKASSDTWAKKNCKQYKNWVFLTGRIGFTLALRGRYWRKVLAILFDFLLQ